MSNIVSLNTALTPEAPQQIELVFNGTKVTLHFENTIENPFVFQRIEEILLAASELK